MDGTEEAAPLKKLALVFCSHDRVHAHWAYSFAHLVGHFIGSGGFIEETGERYSMGLNWCQTSLLADGRQKLVEDCKKHGVEKIAWVDTDMTFPKNALHMLLRHGEKIVGVNYPSRRPPFRFTSATLDNKPLQTKPDSKGLVEVGHMGFGLVVTDISIFDDDRPYFSFEWEKQQDRWTQIGEDVYFAREMRARGHKLYVDQELSAMIGHEGDYTFTAEDMAIVDAETPELVA